MASPPPTIQATSAQKTPQLALPDTIVPGQIVWTYAIAIGLIHLLALTAVIPWLFSWTGLIVMVAGIHVFGQGINLCYHRILTHRSGRPADAARAYLRDSGVVLHGGHSGQVGVDPSISPQAFR